MPKIKMDRSHGLSMEDARSKVENLAADLEIRYGIKSNWSGNKMNFKRTGVKGYVELADGKVSVLVDLSMMLSPLKGKVEERLKKNLEEEFAC